MKWNEKLPDVSQWQPKGSKEDTLRNALMMTCQVAQRRIVARAEAEIAFNVKNFDSGLGVEDIVRVSRTRFPWTQNWLNRSVQGGPEHDR